MESCLTDEYIHEKLTEIYNNCDLDCSNCVPVSKLLDYIELNASGHIIYEFSQLREELDPAHSNPNVSCEIFVKSVTEFADNNQINHIATQRSEQFVLESTPDMDNDDNVNEELVRELQFKIKKLTEEVNYLKLQLVSVEERDDILQTENNNRLRKILELERFVDHLQQVKKNDEENLEVTSFYEKEFHKLKKSLAENGKNITDLKNTIKRNEEDKKKLNLKITFYTKRGEDNLKLLRNLDIELTNKEKTVASLLEINSQLQSKLSEYQKDIEHYTKVLSILKDEKAILEKYVEECHMYRSYSNVLKNTPRRTISNSSNKIETPLSSRILTSVFKFNSPDLLYSLANPVSPYLDSPIISQTSTPVDQGTKRDDFNSSPSISDNVFLSPGEEQNSFEDVNNGSIRLNESFIKQLNGPHCDSIGDEMLLADQDFHRNECRQIIRNQTLRIEELEETLAKIKITEEQLVEENANVKRDYDTLHKEMKEKLMEEIKARDLLHNEIRTIPKRGNFNKLEKRLERKDAEIEKLAGLLKCETQRRKNVLKEKLLMQEKLLHLVQSVKKFKKICQQLKFQNTKIKCDTINFQNYFKTVLQRSSAHLLELSNLQSAVVIKSPSADVNSNSDPHHPSVCKPDANTLSEAQVTNVAELKSPRSMCCKMCVYCIMFLIVIFVSAIFLLRTCKWNQIFSFYIKKSYSQHPPL